MRLPSNLPGACLPLLMQVVRARGIVINLEGWQGEASSTSATCRSFSSQRFALRFCLQTAAAASGLSPLTDSSRCFYQRMATALQALYPHSP